MSEALGPQQLAPLLLGAYLVGGVVVAAMLQSRGHDRAAVLGALLAWPMLVPVLQAPPPRPQVTVASGPLRGRIDEALAALEHTLGDPAAAGVPWSADLAGLRAALYAADARIGLVDRLLQAPAEPDDDAVARGVATLQAARHKAAGEVAAVLSEVVQLRLQVGVAALAGDGGALSERLRELSHRAAALEELAGLGSSEASGA